MAVWFEGNTEIACNIKQVKDSLENLGEHYVGVVSLMPGLTSVELVEVGVDFVTIRTNEGLMKRTNITKRIEAGSVVVEFDEEYQAGSMVTTKSHFWMHSQPATPALTITLFSAELKPPDCWAFSTGSSAAAAQGTLS